MDLRRHAWTARYHRGFSYVEATGAMIILALGITTGLNLFGSYARGSGIETDRVIAHQLCAGLLSEAQTRLFESGVYGAGSFGRGDWETVRSDFDDIDDYDGWTESPPLGRDDLPLAGYEDFARSVEVYNVNDDDLNVRATDGSTGVKAIEVTVEKDGKLLARLRAYRMRTP